MFLLHLLPDSFLLFIVNTVLILGISLTIIAFFIPSFNPIIQKYKLLAQIVGVLILSLGIYWKGGYSVEMDWREKVRVMEEQIKNLKVEVDQANGKVKTVVVTKIQKVVDKQVEIQKVIEEKEKIIDAECKVPKEAIQILNTAAENPGNAPAQDLGDKK